MLVTNLWPTKLLCIIQLLLGRLLFETTKFRFGPFLVS
jgi:hypothetical protein